MPELEQPVAIRSRNAKVEFGKKLEENTENPPSLRHKKLTQSLEQQKRTISKTTPIQIKKPNDTHIPIHKHISRETLNYSTNVIRELPDLSGTNHILNNRFVTNNALAPFSYHSLNNTPFQMPETTMAGNIALVAVANHVCRNIISGTQQWIGDKLNTLKTIDNKITQAVSLPNVISDAQQWIGDKLDTLKEIDNKITKAVTLPVAEAGLFSRKRYTYHRSYFFSKSNWGPGRHTRRQYTRKRKRGWFF